MRLQRRNPSGSTAGLWRIRDFLGGQIVLVHAQPFRMEEEGIWISDGWCWVVATEDNRGEAWDWICQSGLQGQRFRTRKEAMQALQASISISDTSS